MSAPSGQSATLAPQAPACPVRCLYIFKLGFGLFAALFCSSSFDFSSSVFALISSFSASLSFFRRLQSRYCISYGWRQALFPVLQFLLALGQLLFPSASCSSASASFACRRKASARLRTDFVKRSGCFACLFNAVGKPVDRFLICIGKRELSASLIYIGLGEDLHFKVLFGYHYSR